MKNIIYIYSYVHIYIYKTLGISYLHLWGQLCCLLAIPYWQLALDFLLDSHWIAKESDAISASADSAVVKKGAPAVPGKRVAKKILAKTGDSLALCSGSQ